MTLEEAIHHEAAESIHVADLLKALPRYGDHRAAELLRRVPVSGSRRVRDLTLRQKVRVLELIEGTAGQPRRPRTDVEVLVWLGGKRRASATRRHLWAAGHPRTLCGLTIPFAAHRLDAASGVADCRTCWVAARW